MRTYYSKDEMTDTGILFSVNQTLPWTFLGSLEVSQAAVEVCSWRFFMDFLMNWG
jgi:hypothetical protein